MIQGLHTLADGEGSQLADTSRFSIQSGSPEHDPYSTFRLIQPERKVKRRYVHPGQLELDFEARTGSAIAETVVWTDNEVVELHVCLLERSIEQLREKVTPEEEVNEILHWMFMPDLTRWEYTPQGVRYRRRSVDVPFSFVRCCRMAGLDPYELREKTIEEITAINVKFDARYLN